MTWSSSADITTSQFSKAEGTFYVRSNVLGAHAINLSAVIETTEGVRNLSTTATVNVEDTVAPGLATNPSPADGAILNMDTLRAMGLSWTAPTDATALTYQYGVSTAADKDQVYPDGTFMWTIPNYNGSSTGSARSVPNNNLPDGTYYWQVRHTDAAGNVGPWVMWSFTIDSTIPTFTLTDDGNPRTPILDGDVINISKLGGQDIRFAKESISDKLYVNGSLIFNHGYFNTNKTGKIKAAFKNDGIYTLHTEDLAGNKSDSITITIDTTPPEAPKNLSWTGVDGHVASGGFTNSQSGDLSWEHEDPSDVDKNIYKFWTNIPGYFEGYSNAWTTDDPKYFTGSSIWTNFEHEGQFFFCVVAVDIVGNESACSDHYTVTYDSTAPSAPEINTPVNGLYFKTSPILNKWSASTDSLSGVKGYQIAYQYDDGHTFGGTNACAGETATSLGIGVDGKFIGCRDVTSTQRNHAPGIGEQGGVTIWVRAQDNAGNWSNWSSPVHYVYDETAPVITLNGDATVTVETGDTYTDAGATALDAIDGDLTSAILVANPVDANTVGSYTVTYTVTDSAGNTATATRTVNVEDTTAPVVTINALTTTDTTPTLTGDVEDGTVEVIVTIGGVDYPATINLDGTWSLTLTSPLALGTHAVIVSAKDASGNVGTANADITVEEIPAEETEGESEVQIVVTPQPTPLEQEVLGDQDDQTETEGNTDEQGSSDVQAATDDKTGETYGANILGLAWYWWLLILAAIVAAWWLIAGYLRRKSQES